MEQTDREREREYTSENEKDRRSKSGGSQDNRPSPPAFYTVRGEKGGLTRFLSE